VSRPLDLVVPITLYRGLEQLHTVLRDYNDSSDDKVRARHRLQVAALLARFLRDHGSCIRRVAGRTWDTLTIVPSSGGRSGAHPLERAVKAAAAHRPLYRQLLERTDAAVAHRQSNEKAYRVTEDVRGRGVLLIDDTFTTGARVQSCASALSLAGADVVAAVVVGRFMRPEFSDESRALWERQEKLDFDFASCCIH
jgi:phosphoribosylpyrophosphate synthetase